MIQLPRSAYRLLALVGLGAAAATVLIHNEGQGGNARAADAPATPAPTFTALRGKASAGLPQAAREALSRAGAPDTAPTFVTDDGDTKVVVVRGAQTYLQLYNTATERSTIVATPPDVLRKNAGTWVASRGSAEGTKLAMLVPDGVASVSVTGDSGSKSATPVRGNILVVDDQDYPELTYDFGGTQHLVRFRPPPEAAPDLP